MSAARHHEATVARHGGVLTPTTPAFTAEEVAAVALNALADRVEAATNAVNALDVEVEIALFEPDALMTAIRPNAAGTKVIYTINGGQDRTCWSGDWTLGRKQRTETAAALRARAALRSAPHD